MQVYIERTGLIPEELLQNETLFHVANGYVGVRGNFEEGYPEGLPTIRGTYINAFYDDVPIKYGERLHGFPAMGQRMLNVTDTQSLEIALNEEQFGLFDAASILLERRLDMQNGYALRRALWRGQGGEVEILFRRMASFVCEQLVLFEMELVSHGFSGKVTLRAKQEGNVANFATEGDPRVASEREKNLFVRRVWADATGSYVTSETARSDLFLTSAVGCRGEGIQSSGCLLNDTGAEHVFSGHLEPGGRIRLEKYCIFVDSRRFSQQEAQAMALLKDTMQTAPETWRQCQRQYLDRFWAKSRVCILGDEALQNGMDFCLYQLLQSAGKDCLSNIPAKGLSGEGYEGHYFWDTEIYMFPFFLLTDPAVAQSLLRFRYGILEGARAHARDMGHKRGALYPWRTIAGAECSSYFPSGSAQYHINGDVSHSFISYY
ncbi:MAG: glycoside hydrolase family 65 protein, partial [Clostridia bacterium]|nr:glycoside hydrolase family 65 protein [Clostridia bacterium]